MAEPMTDERLAELRHLATVKLPWVSRGDLKSALREIERSRAECAELRAYVKAAREPMAIYAEMYRSYLKSPTAVHGEMPPPPEMSDKPICIAQVGDKPSTPMARIAGQWPGDGLEELP